VTIEQIAAPFARRQAPGTKTPNGRSSSRN
jgi:hypothetical protein